MISAKLQGNLSFKIMRMLFLCWYKYGFNSLPAKINLGISCGFFVTHVVCLYILNVIYAKHASKHMQTAFS